MNDAVAWANVASGITAAIALLLSIWQFMRKGREEAELQARRQADLVIAWAVYETGNDGAEADEYGVIMVNGSTEVALNVDVKTGHAASTGKSLIADDIPGQRFALIPPGVYYVAHREGRWSAPVPVDTTNGKFVVTIGNSGDPSQINLVPITRRPEPKRVMYFSYRIAQSWWERDADSMVTRLKSGPPTSLWSTEFDNSQKVDLQPLTPHKPNNDVQALIERVFRYFATPNSDPGIGARARVKPEFREWGLVSIRRTRRNGQGIYLQMATDDQGPRLYFSGDYKGTVPNDGLIYIEGDQGARDRVEQPRKLSSAYWMQHFDELVDVLRKAVDSVRPPAA